MAVADLPRWRAEILGRLGRRLTGPNETWPIERRSERAQSRHLIATDGIASGAISTNVDHVIGTGLSMRSTINHRDLGISEGVAIKLRKQLNARFHMWASSRLADAGRRMNFYQLQGLTLRSMLASGDVGVYLPVMEPRPGWPFRLALKVVEADLICNRETEPNIPGRLHDGIVLDEFGGPVAAWVASSHPAEWSQVQRTWRRIEFEARGRQQFLHLFDADRPDQVRGRPYLMPVMCKLEELSRYTEAEIAKAVTTAMLTLVTKMDAQAFIDLFGGDENAGERDKYLNRAFAWDGEMRPNSAINLLPGEDAQAFSSQANTAFDPFFRSVVQQVAVGLRLPFEVLMKRFEASYTASRAARLEAGLIWRMRRDSVDSWLCTPVYDEWLADEVAMGRVKMPGFFEDPFRRFLWSACEWVGDGPGILDPLKEAQASQMRVDLGISTRERESIEYDGIPWDQKNEQLATEKRARVSAKLELVAEESASGRPPQAPSRSNPATPEPEDRSDD